MKIQITTERDIKEEDFWPWVRAEMYSMRCDDPKCVVREKDFSKLLETSSISFEQDTPYTKIRTTYRILAEGKEGKGE